MAASPPRPKNVTPRPRTTRHGIQYYHIYSVIGTAEIDGHKLLKVRNPAGRELYSGPWSDRDTENWTAARRAQLGQDKGDDGFFFMDLDSFIENFSIVTLSQDEMKAQTRATYLSLDQPTDQVGSGPCPTCNEYTLELTSPVAQQVTVHLDTLFPTRLIGPRAGNFCTYFLQDHDFYVSEEASELGRQVKRGKQDSWKVSLAAGETKTFHVRIDQGFNKFDYEVPEVFETPYDWAMSATGDESAVTLTAAEGTPASLAYPTLTYGGK